MPRLLCGSLYGTRTKNLVLFLLERFIATQECVRRFRLQELALQLQVPGELVRQVSARAGVEGTETSKQTLRGQERPLVASCSTTQAPPLYVSRLDTR